MCPETRKGLRAREDPDEADASNPNGLRPRNRPDDDPGMSCGWEIRSPLGGSGTDAESIGDSGYHPSHDAVTSWPSPAPTRGERHAPVRLFPASSRSAAGMAQPKPSPRSTSRWPCGQRAPAPRPPAPADGDRPRRPAPRQHPRRPPSRPPCRAVTGTGRARASQACRASRPVKPSMRLASVGPLHHDHGHLGLLVGRQPADRGPDLGGGRDDGHEQPVTAQRGHGPQVVVGLVGWRRTGPEPLGRRAAAAPSSPGNGDGARVRSCGACPFIGVGPAGSGPWSLVVGRAARRHRSRRPAAIPQPDRTGGK